MSFMNSVDEVVASVMNGSDHLYDEDILRSLVVSMTTLPSPFGTSWSSDKDPLDFSSAWNIIICNGLLLKNHSSGWLDRSGNFYGADFAWHERLLYWMGREVADVENEGWARIGIGNYQCRYKLSSVQIKKIVSLGVPVDRVLEFERPSFDESIVFDI